MTGEFRREAGLCGRGYHVRVWDTDTRQEVLALSTKTPEGTEAVVRSLAFSPEGNRVMTLVNDTLRLWPV